MGFLKLVFFSFWKIFFWLFGFLGAILSFAQKLTQNFSFFYFDGQKIRINMAQLSRIDVWIWREKKLVSGFISVNLLMFDIDLVRVLNSQFDFMTTKEKRQEQRSVWRKFVFTWTKKRLSYVKKNVQQKYENFPKWDGFPEKVSQLPCKRQYYEN